MRAGDTLSLVGFFYHRSVAQLAGANHIPNPNLIFVAQVLTIPPASYVPPVTVVPAQQRVERAPLAPPTTGTAPSPAPAANLSGVWQCIGFYESGDNPAENTGNGFYGEFQFAPGTWDWAVEHLYGGNAPYRSYPYAAAAPSSVQLAAAEYVQANTASGWGNWPVTSRKCGV